MPREIGHASIHNRIGIMVGAGHVPGMNAVIMGAALAATKLGWEMVGIRDGFDGLLHPERYPEGGLVPLSPKLIENLDPTSSGLLGQSPRVDPFHVRQVTEDDMVEEVDMSDDLLKALKAENIDAVISVVGGRGMSILYRLHRKGLHVVCVPRSIEDDIASTAVSFGFNSALSFTIEMLDRVRQAAQAARKIAVVEVLGEQAGWLALQAGIAVCADAVLIPEIPCDLKVVAASVAGQDDTRAALRAGGGGRRGEVRRRRDSPRQSPPPSKRLCRRWRRVMPATTSSGDRVRPPRPWRAGCSCSSPRRPSPSSWAPGSGAAPHGRRPSTWLWPTAPGRLRP